MGTGSAAILALGLSLVSAAPVVGASTTVTRGPYLQCGTPQSLVVRWRTATATDSRVRYGVAIP